MSQHRIVAISLLLLLTSIAAKAAQEFNLTQWLSDFINNYTVERWQGRIRHIIKMPCLIGYAKDRTGTCRKIIPNKGKRYVEYFLEDFRIDSPQFFIPI